MSSFASPSSEAEKLFAAHQEGARKAVERVFGVLFKLFSLLYRPSRLWFENDMNDIIRAAAIIHNMCVEHRKANYSGTRRSREIDDTAMPDDISLLSAPEGRAAAAAFWRYHLKSIQSKQEHVKLKEALTAHIWLLRGFQHDVADVSSDAPD
jgi:Plant transposon protein